MDALKAEIAVKRKAFQDDPYLSSRPNKYMRKGEIEELRLEQESKEKEEKAAKEQLEKQAVSEVWHTYCLNEPVFESLSLEKSIGAEVTFNL